MNTTYSWVIEPERMKHILAHFKSKGIEVTGEFVALMATRAQLIMNDDFPKDWKERIPDTDGFEHEITVIFLHMMSRGLDGYLVAKKLFSAIVEMDNRRGGTRYEEVKPMTMKMLRAIAAAGPGLSKAERQRIVEAVTDDNEAPIGAETSPENREALPQLKGARKIEIDWKAAKEAAIEVARKVLIFFVTANATLAVERGAAPAKDLKKFRSAGKEVPLARLNINDDELFEAWMGVMRSRARVITNDDYPYVWSSRMPYDRAEVHLLFDILATGSDEPTAARLLLTAIQAADKERGGIPFEVIAPTFTKRLIEAAADEIELGPNVKRFVTVDGSDPQEVVDQLDLTRMDERQRLVEYVRKNMPPSKAGEVLVVDVQERDDGTRTLQAFTLLLSELPKNVPQQSGELREIASQGLHPYLFFWNGNKKQPQGVTATGGFGELATPPASA